LQGLHLRSLHLIVCIQLSVMIRSRAKSLLFILLVYDRYHSTAVLSSITLTDHADTSDLPEASRHYHRQLQPERMSDLTHALQYLQQYMVTWASRDNRTTRVMEAARRRPLIGRHGFGVPTSFPAILVSYTLLMSFQAPGPWVRILPHSDSSLVVCVLSLLFVPSSIPSCGQPPSYRHPLVRDPTVYLSGKPCTLWSISSSSAELYFLSSIIISHFILLHACSNPLDFICSPYMVSNVEMLVQSCSLKPN